MRYSFGNRNERLEVVKERFLERFLRKQELEDLKLSKEIFQRREGGEKRKTKVGRSEGSQEIKRTVVSDSKVAAGEGKSVQTKL